MTIRNHYPPYYSGSTIRTGDLSWEDTYAIALALHRSYSTVDLEQVSLGMIFHWTLDLPEFDDDPELANKVILMSIYQEWFEEANSL